MPNFSLFWINFDLCKTTLMFSQKRTTMRVHHIAYEKSRNILEQYRESQKTTYGVRRQKAISL